MLHVQGGRRDISGEKGKSTEEVSPFTGKARCHGGSVPSEGCSREFLGISLMQPVSIPRVGTLSPVSLWDVGTGCFGGNPCPGQSPDTNTEASLVQHQFCTSLHSSPSQLQLLKAEGRRNVSVLCCSLKIKIKKHAKLAISA